MTAGTDAPAISREEAQALIDAYPLNAVLGLELVEWRRGEIRFRFVPPPFARNPSAPALPAGALHGGVLMTVLDTAACFAVTSVNGIDVSTVDMRTDFLRPAVEGELVVEGRPLRVGRRLAIADATVLTPDGRALATGRATTVW